MIAYKFQRGCKPIGWKRTVNYIKGQITDKSHILLIFNCKKIEFYVKIHEYLYSFTNYNGDNN